MKFFWLNIAFLLMFFTAYPQWKSYQIYGNDTINKVDLNGLKQGLWIYFNDNYKNRIVQKGYYKDGKKQGVWEIYYPNGQLKAKITFKDNRQYGPVTTYYPNGNVREQGYWKGNKWVGDYKFFYENGNPMYIWHFNQYGRRDGEQKYFYDNGKLMLVGTWKDGKEYGTLKEYYKNGRIKKISHWQDGELNGEVIEYYPDGQPKIKRYFVKGQEKIEQTVYYAHVTAKPKPDSDTVSKDYYRQFTGTGKFKFYNDKGQVISEGYFRNGVLYNGKRYIYDRNGKLIRIAIIREGKVSEIINQPQEQDQ